MTHHMGHHMAGRIVKIAVFAIVAAFLFGFVVMGLWNWLMPELFGLKAIGYWQAWGLLVLSWILFGGLRGGHHHGHWRHRMHERWAKMTPEEKEKFRHGTRHHWHRHEDGDEPPTEP